MSAYNHLLTFKSKIKIIGKVKLKTALHIGSQRSIDPIESDNPVIKDNDGKPFIPGSSFKGAIRSAMESLLEGLNKKVCHPTEDVYCIKKEDWRDINKVLNSDVCLLCKFMGSPYLASKTKFHDMPLFHKNMDLSNLLQERDGVAIDREYLSAAPKKKYDFETVTPGWEFDLQVLIDNPEDYELGLLFTVFDLFNEGLFTLGGNSSRGLGLIEIEILQIDRWTADKLKEAFEKDVEEISPERYDKTSDIDNYMKKMKEAFKKWVKTSSQKEG